MPSLKSAAAQFMVLSALLVGLGPNSGSAQQVATGEVIVLTTTTTQDSGILAALEKAFTQRSGLKVKTIVAGSGDILRQGARGEGDVLLTHSPQAEKDWMAQGNGLSRRLVMYNDFVIIGPTADPAGVKGLRAADAFRKIAAAKAPIVSRGDQSGTHVRELAMWKAAGVDPKGQPWYRETGQGQGLTMEVASQHQAYAFTDRGTYMAHAKRLGLPILVENDPQLYNIYHVMPVNAAKFPRVNVQRADTFADWLLSPEGQAVISEFGRERYGRALFTPAAGKTEEQLLTN